MLMHSRFVLLLLLAIHGHLILVMVLLHIFVQKHFYCFFITAYTLCHETNYRHQKDHYIKIPHCNIKIAVKELCRDTDGLTKISCPVTKILMQSMVLTADSTGDGKSIDDEAHYK